MGGDLSNSWSRRSFKREVALAAFAVWVVLTYKVFWATDVTVINALNAPYGTASMSIWLYIMAAFGLDSVTRSMMGGQSNMESSHRSMQIPPSRRIQAKASGGQQPENRVVAVPAPPPPGTFS